MDPFLCGKGNLELRIPGFYLGCEERYNYVSFRQHEGVRRLEGGYLSYKRYLLLMAELHEEYPIDAL